MDKQKEVKLVEVNPTILKDIDNYKLEDAEYEVLVQMGIDASEVKAYSQWILGKLVDFLLNHKHGDLAKYAKDVNQSYEVLRQYGITYARFIAEDPDFHPWKYAGSIPWRVLQLAANKSDTPQKLVDELHDEGATTIEGAYRAIKSKETGTEIPRKPQVKLSWNAEKEKYTLNLKQEDFDLIDWTNVKEQIIGYLEALD